jgi:hypothetical protein
LSTKPCAETSASSVCKVAAAVIDQGRGSKRGAAHGAGPAPAHTGTLRLVPAGVRGWADEAKRRARRQVGGYRRGRVVHGDVERVALRRKPGRLSVGRGSVQLWGSAPVRGGDSGPFSNHPGCVGLAQPDGVRIAGSQPHALEVDGLARAWVAAVEDRAAGRAVDLQMDGVDQVIGY